MGPRDREDSGSFLPGKLWGSPNPHPYALCSAWGWARRPGRPTWLQLSGNGWEQSPHDSPGSSTREQLSRCAGAQIPRRRGVTEPQLHLGAAPSQPASQWSSPAAVSGTRQPQTCPSKKPSNGTPFSPHLNPAQGHQNVHRSTRVTRETHPQGAGYSEGGTYPSTRFSRHLKLRNAPTRSLLPRRCPHPPVLLPRLSTCAPAGPTPSPP